MADNESFLRKVVRFVANPATDWADLNSPRHGDPRDTALDKSELKAMIERKRRNDFVRKREFDMLRKIRREGLSPEQLAALGSSSRLDDSEVRLLDSPARPGGGVKAKIDAIEQEMVVEGNLAGGRRPAGPHGASTAPPSLPVLDLTIEDSRATARAPSRAGARAHRDTAPAGAEASAALAPAPPVLSTPATLGNADFPDGFAVEVSEVAHDPELDEAVIAFANADFPLCERLLQRMTAPGGARAHHAETWLVLFDLYRAIGQQQRFEALALEYAQQFGWSAPQWYSLPRLVADAAVEPPVSAAARVAGEVGWSCPERLDAAAVARLRAQSLQLPLPWVFDWSALRSVEPDGAQQLSTLFRQWAQQPLEMRWLAGERLLQALQEAAPRGARAADPAYWLARLDTLRLAHRGDEFDEAAIDYCVTYEVSPPSWEPVRCKALLSGARPAARGSSQRGTITATTGFQETVVGDEGAGPATAHLELSGQLVGDIGETLARLGASLGQATLVSVSCARLIRLDFLAAGDLLNWVLGRRQDGCTVQFVDAHRLVALFFGAMGISEHAKVHLRKV